MFQQYSNTPRGFLPTLFGLMLLVFLVPSICAGSVAEKRRVAVLKELELTPAEEKAFWPVYEDYTRELLTVFEQTADAAYKLYQGREQLGDDVVDRYTSAILKGERQQAEIHLAYQPRFRQILDARKTARLFQFERRLHTYMNAEISREFPLIR